MKIVLLSGGSGKRLWPLSNELRSKQFLKVLPGVDGGKESMVQRVWRQLEQSSLSGSSFIAAGASQTEMIRSQLPGRVPVIVEPSRRDTFPAIALASVYLYSIANAGLQETVTVLPVDPFVEEDFFHTVSSLEEILERNSADIALIGVKPTYPSEKYGYILPDHPADRGASCFRVKAFKEKPEKSLAKQYIAESAYWNCGVFSFRLNYMIQLLIDKGLPIHYEELARQYDQLEKISFDYEVVEKADCVVMVPYEGEWKDLGTWNTLTEEIPSAVSGKGSISSDCGNTHLINELDIPVAVLGLSNIVVATGPDGILVADKSASPRLKEFISDLEQRPMYEERRWGWYRVLDIQKSADGHEVLTKRIRIEAGKNSSYHYHLHRDEYWTITMGSGEVCIQDRVSSVRAGDVLKIPAGTIHGIRALEDLEFIEVQAGREVTEEDTIRLAFTWEEMTHPV